MGLVSPTGRAKDYFKYLRKYFIPNRRNVISKYIT
jgi:hypothetical protein